MSSLWSVEARSYPQDTRSSEASTVKFWLRPGSYTVGRGQADLVLVDDKSISRIHATINVPTLEEWQQHSGENRPFMTIVDSSRYGTLATATAAEMPADGSAGATFTALHRWIVRFGCLTPFKIFNIDKSLCLHHSVATVAAQGDNDVAAILTAADSLGLPLVDDLVSNENALLITPDHYVKVDGQVICAIMLERLMVSGHWLTKWMTQKVWINSCPQENKYTVGLLDCGTAAGANSMKKTIKAAHNDRLFKNMTFVWTHEALEADSHLSTAVELAGGTVIHLPAKGRKPKLPNDAILVLPHSNHSSTARSSMDKVPSLTAALRKHPWTNVELLIDAVKWNSLKEAVHAPAEAGGGDDDDGDGTVKGAASKKKRGALSQDVDESPSGGHRSMSKKRGRGAAAAAAAGDGVEAKDDGAASDVTELTDDEAAGGGGPSKQTKVVTMVLSDSDNDAVANPQQQRAVGGSGSGSGFKRKAAAAAVQEDSDDSAGGVAQGGAGTSSRRVTTGGGRTTKSPANKRARLAPVPTGATAATVADDDNQQQQEEEEKKPLVAMPLVALPKPEPTTNMPGWKPTARKVLATQGVKHEEEEESPNKPQQQNQQPHRRGNKRRHPKHKDDDDGDDDDKDAATSAVAAAVKRQKDCVIKVEADDNKVAVDVSNVVYEEGLIVVPARYPTATAAAAGGGGGSPSKGKKGKGKQQQQNKHLVGGITSSSTATASITSINFKAFRKRTDPAAPAKARARARQQSVVIVAFDPQPYTEVTVDVAAYERAERERRRKEKKVDEMFETDHQVSGGRGKAALQAGQKTLAQFLTGGASGSEARSNQLRGDGARGKGKTRATASTRGAKK